MQPRLTLIKKFNALVLEVVLGMTIHLVVGTLHQIIRQGLIIIISRRHVRGASNPGGSSSGYSANRRPSGPCFRCG